MIFVYWNYDLCIIVTLLPKSGDPSIPVVLGGGVLEFYVEI